MLDDARGAFERHHWDWAYELFHEADRDACEPRSTW